MQVVITWSEPFFVLAGTSASESCVSFSVNKSVKLHKHHVRTSGLSRCWREVSGKIGAAASDVQG